MDDDLPRTRGDAASQLSHEGLESYSQDELLARIGQLKAEIERVHTQYDKAANHRKLADSLFRTDGSD